MNVFRGAKVIAAVYLVVLAVAMLVVSGGVIDIAAAASLPVIATAQAIVFAMLYATTFHGEGPENHSGESLKFSAMHGSRGTINKAAHV